MTVRNRGKFDHIKPLPYKRFHPEVLAALSCMWFGKPYFNAYNRPHSAIGGGTGYINDMRYVALMDEGSYSLLFTSETVRQLRARGIDPKRMIRTATLDPFHSTINEQYQAVEADLRALGILGHVRHA